MTFFSARAPSDDWNPQDLTEEELEPKILLDEKKEDDQDEEDVDGEKKAMKEPLVEAALGSGDDLVALDLLAKQMEEDKYNMDDLGEEPEI